MALVVALLTGMLWRMSTTSAELVRETSCEEAKWKCAYRTGCGMALQNYMVGCSAVLRDGTKTCPEICQHALIALTSTDEGKNLMTCECTDSFCQETKQRVEVCRPQVTRATRNESIVSCKVAQWICAADGVCSTALDYYHRYCRSMFHGRKCSNRCKNSISILRRQEKAAKLDNCVCEGREDYNCLAVRTNMARLCYHKEPDPLPEETETDQNQLTPTETRDSSSLPAPCLCLIVTLILLST